MLAAKSKSRTELTRFRVLPANPLRKQQGWGMCHSEVKEAPVRAGDMSGDTYPSPAAGKRYKRLHQSPE